MNRRTFARLVGLPWPPLLAVAILVTLAFIVVWRQSAMEREYDTPRPLVVLVGGDTQGVLQTCGGVEAQPGGLSRRGAIVRQAREKADVLVTDLGNAPGGLTTYDLVKFTSILRSEMALGLAAHNLGPGEVLLGAAALRTLSKDLNVPFVSANVRDSTGELIAPPLRVIKVGRQRIAIVGVLDPNLAPSHKESTRDRATPYEFIIDEPPSDKLTVDDPLLAIDAALHATTESFDTLLVLAYLDPDNAQALQQAFARDRELPGSAVPPMSTLLVVPSSPKFDAAQPFDFGWLTAVPPRGAGLVRFDMTAAPTATWQASHVSIDAALPEDTAQLANIVRYHRALAQHDFTATETGLKVNLPPEIASEHRVVGAQSCRTCHIQDCLAWDNTRHARAFQTLVDRGVQYDSACQKCHTTGYGWAGGFESADRSPNLASVSCESCHGPSLAHAIDPQIRTTLMAKQQCVHCHDQTTSPGFDYDMAWPAIQHGRAKDWNKLPTH